MPPCRTAVEMCAGSMPDSRATIASASSEVCRCCTSKSAGTYSASMTGVIGNTFRRRTVPLQVCDSVAAVAIAGLARSVSARSIGTRMDLNICASLSGNQSSTNTASASALVTRSLLQQLWGDEQHQPAATECHVRPVVNRKIEYCETRRRQIVAERLASGGVAATGKRQRQPMHSWIVPDQYQPARIGGGCVAYGLQELRRIGAIKFRQNFNQRFWHEVVHR